jgi:hypothetical protein
VCLDNRSAAARAARLLAEALDDGASELSLWRASGCLGCDSRSAAARAAADSRGAEELDSGTAELSLWRASRPMGCAEVKLRLLPRRRSPLHVALPLAVSALMRVVPADKHVSLRSRSPDDDRRVLVRTGVSAGFPDRSEL